MVIDSSAVVAMFLEAPAEPALRLAIERDPRRMMSAATLIETGIVVEARAGAAGAQFVDRFMRETETEVVPVDERQAQYALDGWRRFGKGRHRARLNLGACFTYGLAALTGQPVLCVGDDFAQTDVAVVSLDVEARR